MTGLIMIIISAAVVAAIGASVIWIAARKRAARRERGAVDLYRQYFTGVKAATQEYLLQAPPDEEWLAGLKPRALEAARISAQATAAESTVRRREEAEGDTPLKGRRLGLNSAGSDARWRRLGRAAAAGLPLVFGALWVAFWGFSRNTFFATFAAGIQAIAMAAAVFLTARVAWSYRLAGRRQLNAVLVVWAASPALLAALVAAAAGLPAVPDAIIGVAVGVAAALVYAGSRRRIAAFQLSVPLAVDSLADADRPLDATAAPRSGPRVTAGTGTMWQLNRARALTFVALREDDHDRLMEALPLLREVIQDQALDPALALLAADDLVNAEDVLAERSRDGTRYAAAVDLYAELAARNPQVRGAAARLHGHRASYQAFVQQAAADDVLAADDEAARERALARAADANHAISRELAAALEVIGPQDEIRPQYLSMLGEHLCLSLDLAGQDRTGEAVALCREALALPAGRRREYRPRYELSLAFSLISRWDVHGDDRDLDEAEALLKRLVRLGNPVEARARELLLGIPGRGAETER